MRYKMTSEILFESLRSARTKYPNVPLDVLEQFVTADKSGTYKYVEKMCQFYSEGFSHLSIISNISKYQKIEIFLDNKDITTKSFDDTLSDIEFGELKKINSYNERRNRERKSGLIFENDKYRVYSIDNFQDSVAKGKGTKWCTAQDKEKFKFYLNQYNIYVIFDKTENESSPFKKLCYLNGGVETTFVDRNNVHYFDDSGVYAELKDELGSEIMDLMF